MMTASASHLFSIGLIGFGAAVCSVTSGSLKKDGSLLLPSNPFGVKQSPYGEVIAMAIQGSVDNLHHGTCDGHCEPEAGMHSHPQAPHAHDFSATSSLSERFTHLLHSIEASAETRTNPKEASTAQRFAVRRAMENKLRFAYELDPSHYGNYNTYHLFLSEPQFGTRSYRAQQVIHLAGQTIDYCLRKQDDPRPALTAASAAQNLLLLMFQNPAEHSLEAMDQVFEVMTQSIAIHERIRNEWIRNRNWERLSPERQMEIEERYRLVGKLREDAEVTLTRLHAEASRKILH